MKIAVALAGWYLAGMAVCVRGCRQYKVPANYEVHSATAGLTVLASQCHIKYDSYVNLTVIQTFKEINCQENNYQLVSSGFVNIQMEGCS